MGRFSRNLLTGSVLLFIAGWLRFSFTGQIHVDGNYPSLSGAVVIGILVIGAILSISFAGWYLYKNPVTDFNSWLQQHKIPLLISLVLLVLTPPLLTNDVLSYLYYGRMASEGADPYLQSAFGQASSNFYYPYVSALYRETRSNYGPLSLLASVGPGLFNAVPAGLLAYKLINAVFLVLLFFQLRNYPRMLPLFFTAITLIELVGQGHNDGMAVYFTFLAVQSARAGKPFAAALFSLVMLLCKFLYIPFIVLAASLMLPSWRKTIVFACTLFGGLAIWYAVHPASLLAPVFNSAGMRPSGTWADMTYEILKAVSPETTGMQTVIYIFQALAALVCLFMFIRFLRREPWTPQGFTRMLGLFVLVYFILYIHRVFPWYMLFVLPLAFVLPNMNMRWMTVAFGAFVAQGLVHQFVPGSPAAVVFIVSTTAATQICLIIFFLLSLQKNNEPMLPTHAVYPAVNTH